MNEPENHTLRLLREIRGDIHGLDRKVETLDRKVDKNHAELKDSIDSLARVLAGESVLARYAASNVEGRLVDIEKRLSALEQAD